MSGKDADIMMDFVILKLTKKCLLWTIPKKEKAYLALRKSGVSLERREKSNRKENPFLMMIPLF